MRVPYAWQRLPNALAAGTLWGLHRDTEMVWDADGDTAGHYLLKTQPVSGNHRPTSPEEARTSGSILQGQVIEQHANS